MDLGEGETEDDKSIGEAIQLQLAAFVAFGRVKGKGKGKPRGKGKVIREPSNSAESDSRRSRPSRNAFAAAPMDTGQVTPFVNSQVPKGIPVGKIPNPHRILSQQHILQTFRIHLQTREFS